MSPELPYSFLEFLSGCQTHDPAWPEPRPIPVDWDYIRELADRLTSQERVIVVKSRQMMVTWLGCAWLLQRALTGGPGIHVVVSKEERSAKELIERIRILLDGLPKEWLEEWIVSSKSTITLTNKSTAHTSRIVSLPAAPHAVRGLSPRTLFWDEMAFTPNDEEIWTAVKPAVDSGGWFLGVSTPNGPNGVFYRLAHDYCGEFIQHHLGYQQHPERENPDWQTMARAGLSEERWRREQELSFEGAEGRVYDQFNRDLHLTRPTWRAGKRKQSRFYRGIDFGYRKPAVVWAEETRSGEVIVFDCLLGDRWSLEELLIQIHEVDTRHHLSERDYTWTAVDPAGRATSDFGLSPWSALEEAGMKLKTRTSQIAWGLERVRSLLLDANRDVRLRVHPRCEELIRAFDGYMWDVAEDQPKKDGEHDHLMDALRYLVINLPRFHMPGLSRSPRIAGLSPEPDRD
ncbi:hypothetical protein KQI63_03990 [bacterium]|nr:hypothetical protein [bacterium]